MLQDHVLTLGSYHYLLGVAGLLVPPPPRPRVNNHNFLRRILKVPLEFFFNIDDQYEMWVMKDKRNSPDWQMAIISRENVPRARSCHRHRTP